MTSLSRVTESESAARTLADELAPVLKLELHAADSLAVVGQSDVVVTCTSAREAFLTRDHVVRGAFIAAVGADNHDKHEIAPDLYAACRVTVDSPEQAAEIGDLHHALACGAVRHEDVHATLAELVTGAKVGRLFPDDITLFDSTGMGLQDVAAATAVWRRARAAGLGVEFAVNGEERS